MHRAAPAGLLLLLACPGPEEPPQRGAEAKPPTAADVPAEASPAALPAATEEDVQEDASILLLTVARVLAPEETPDILQRRLGERPPRLTVAELQALDPEGRDALVAAIRAAHDRYRDRLDKAHTPAPADQNAAKSLAAFLTAAGAD